MKLKHRFALDIVEVGSSEAPRSFEDSED